MSNLEDLENYISQLEGPEVDAVCKLVLEKYVCSFKGRTGKVLPQRGDYLPSMLPWNIDRSGFLFKDNFNEWVKANFLSSQTNFYVDAVNGVDDREHGLSVDKPWRTLYYACLHIPRFCWSTINVYVAPGTYKPAREEGYTSVANNYNVTNLLNTQYGHINFFFSEGVKITGRFYLRGCHSVEFRGKPVFDFDYYTESYTLSNGKITAASVADAQGAILVDAGALLYIGNTGTFIDPFTGAGTETLVTINRTPLDVPGFRGLGVYANNGGKFMMWSSKVVTNNCFGAYQAYACGVIILDVGAGTGNTNGFRAYQGGYIHYTTQGLTATTAIVCGGGGRVLNGANQSNGRY